MPPAATAKEFDDAYTGVLYGGFMLTAEGPKLLEFNARFGDPETQVIMPRLESDALEAFYMVATGKLDALDLRWTDQVAVCVVLASDGYPGSYEKGKVILGIEEAEELDGVTVFHAGTAFNQDDELVTNGGRVLNVVALARHVRRCSRACLRGVRQNQLRGQAISPRHRASCAGGVIHAE